MDFRLSFAIRTSNETFNILQDFYLSLFYYFNRTVFILNSNVGKPLIVFRLYLFLKQI